MLGLQEVEKHFLNALSELESSLEDTYSLALSKAFNELEVELRPIPAGYGFSYIRNIKGKISGVKFWLSNPEYERPQPLCEFSIAGTDQYGVAFSEKVSERQILTPLPWKNFIPPSLPEN